jgi:K+-transporting ATPase ATPase A chain
VRNNDWLQVFLYLAALVALTPLIGGFMHRIFSGERTFLSPVLGRLSG